MTEARGVSRRQLLLGLGAAPFAAACPACPDRAFASRGAFLSSCHELAAAERKRVKIRRRAGNGGAGREPHLAARRLHEPT